MRGTIRPRLPELTGKVFLSIVRQPQVIHSMDRVVVQRRRRRRQNATQSFIVNKPVVFPAQRVITRRFPADTCSPQAKPACTKTQPALPARPPPLSSETATLALPKGLPSGRIDEQVLLMAFHFSKIGTARKPLRSGCRVGLLPLSYRHNEALRLSEFFLIPVKGEEMGRVHFKGTCHVEDIKPAVPT